MQEKEIKGIGTEKRSICRSQDDDDKESTENVITHKQLWQACRIR